VAEEPFDLPPFEPIAETDNTEAIKAELRRQFAGEAEASDNKWGRESAKKARSVTEAELDEFVRAANGQSGKAALLKRYNLWWLSEAAASLNLIQVLRLRKIDGTRYIKGAG
jgi:hypothetical protein